MTYYQSVIVTYSSILYPFEIKRDIGRKSQFFLPSHLWLPHQGISVGILPHRLMRKKTRMVWLSDSEKKLDDMFSRFDRIPECDRRTDGQTAILRQYSSRYA